MKFHYMLVRYVLFMVFLTSGIQSCAQSGSEDSQLLNMEDRVVYLQDSVKKYDEQPIYRLNIDTKNAYKVLINGFPVGNNFGDISTNLSVVVNHAILKSGNQDIKIQVFPTPVADQEIDALSDDDRFHLSIVRMDREPGQTDGSETVYEFALQEQEGYANEPVFVLIDQFKARIPYSLSGWKNATPFDLADSLTIKQKLYDAYKKMIVAYENKDTDYIWNAYLNADLEWYQSEYFDASMIEDYQQRFIRRGKTYIYGQAQEDIDGVKFYPLEDFNVAFYCDNKIACLEFSSGKFKGESKFAYQALGSLGRNEVQFFDLFYMQSRHSTDMELIVVR